MGKKACERLIPLVHTNIDIIDKVWRTRESEFPTLDDMWSYLIKMQEKYG